MHVQFILLPQCTKFNNLLAKKLSPTVSPIELETKIQIKLDSHFTEELTYYKKYLHII